MRSILFGLAVCLLGLGLSGEANAAPGRVARGRAPVARVAHRGHGVRFTGGHYYRARDFHWSRRVWDAAHRRYQYWDPYYNCWYFYDAAQLAYYPC